VRSAVTDRASSTASGSDVRASDRQTTPMTVGSPRAGLRGNDEIHLSIARSPPRAGIARKSPKPGLSRYTFAGIVQSPRWWARNASRVRSMASAGDTAASTASWSSAISSGMTRATIDGRCHETVPAMAGQGGCRRRSAPPPMPVASARGQVAIRRRSWPVSDGTGPVASIIYPPGRAEPAPAARDRRPVGLTRRGRRGRGRARALHARHRAPARALPPPRNPWLRAALLEQTGREPDGPTPWGDANPWG
jgi:hypothetical protein